MAARRTSFVGKIPLVALQLVIAFLVLFPFFWMLSNALRPDSEVFTIPPRLLPSHIAWHNFVQAWLYLPFGRFFTNSALVAGAMLLPVVTRWIMPRVALIAASVLVALGYLLFLPFHEGYTQVLVNMLIAGVGSGALVAALPAAAASAAPLRSTGVATGLTNSVKTVGGAIASAVFGIALANPDASSTNTAGTLSGYYVVWIVCGATAAVCAVLLLFVPKRAFADAG